MDYPEIKSVDLEKLKLAVYQKVSPYLLDCSVDIDRNIDFLGENVLLMVRGYVLAESESCLRRVIKYPADWKEAFKERWFRGKLLGKFPVKYKMIELDVRTIYPELKPKIPNHPYRFIIQDRTEWQE